MKYTEFEQQVHELGDLLEVQYTPAAVTVSIKHTQYLAVSTTAPFYVNPEPELKNLDCGHNLYLLACELASTPINERTKQRWNVIIGRDEGDEKSLTAYCHTFRGYATNYCSYSSDLKDGAFQFSDKEFNHLIKSLESLPNGDHLAKIAELGKMPAPEVDE